MPIYELEGFCIAVFVKKFWFVLHQLLDNHYVMGWPACIYIANVRLFPDPNKLCASFWSWHYGLS